MFHITVTPLKLQKMRDRKEQLLDIKRRDPLLWESKGAQKSMRTFLTMKKSIWKLIRPKRDMKIKTLIGSVWVCSPSENTQNFLMDFTTYKSILSFIWAVYVDILKAVFREIYWLVLRTPCWIMSLWSLWKACHISMCISTFREVKNTKRYTKSDILVLLFTLKF